LDQEINKINVDLEEFKNENIHKTVSDKIDDKFNQEK